MADPYQWVAAGEEWSEPWGNSAAQWFGAILPRIYSCLPARQIVEIGCGYGRWTEYLRAHCDKLVAVDPATDAIAACRTRFAHDARIIAMQNNGATLERVANNSTDFVFSFDSLVHTPRPTIEGYLSEIARVLTPSGRAFIHHSNLAAYPFAARASLPKALRKLLENARLLARPNQRAPDMSAEIFRQCCQRAGLACIAQELVNWRRSHALIDCFSLLARRGSEHDRPARSFLNRNFMKEAAAIRRRAAAIAASGPTPTSARSHVTRSLSAGMS